MAAMRPSAILQVPQGFHPPWPFQTCAQHPDPGEQYKMSEDSSDHLNLTAFVTVPRGGTPDPARKVGTPTSAGSPHHLTFIEDSVKNLKNYVLRWTSKPDPNITSYTHFTNEHRQHVKIISNTIYRHKTLQLMYTTYDMKEDHDRIYQQQYPDIMVLSDDNEHPYLYGRVLDFFHVNATNNGPDTLLPSGSDPAILQMAWVHWFKLNTPGPSGFCSLWYPSVSFCGAR